MIWARKIYRKVWIKMDNTNIIEILKNTPLFGGMDEGEIRSVIEGAGAVKRSFRKGSFILHSGDKPQSFGILLSGSAMIERDEVWGDRSIISGIEVGQLFAEVYACTGEPMTVSVCAKTDCEVMFLRPDMIIKESGLLTQRLLRITARKNLKLNEKISVITPRTIRGRVMAYLSLMSAKSGSKRITSDFSRQQLADYLCVDRSALSAELGKMKRDGVIDYHLNVFELK